MDDEYVYNESQTGQRLPVKARESKPAAPVVGNDRAAALEKLKKQAAEAVAAAKGGSVGVVSGTGISVGTSASELTTRTPIGTSGATLISLNSSASAKKKPGRPKKLATNAVEKDVKAAKKALITDEITSDSILGQDHVKKLLEVAIKKDQPALLVGDTGCGKTSIIRTMAKERGQKWIRFNMTGETTVDEFVGKYVVIPKRGTVWEDGILLQAMKQGAWLIVDEVNVALAEILFVLHSLLDDDKFVVVANHQSEVVRPHKDFRFFGTMNPVDEYAGTKELNKAFKSRFGMIINMKYPDRTIENQIVEKKAKIKSTDAMKIVDIGNSIRQAKEENEVFYTCSTRDLLQWGNLITELGFQTAFDVAVLNKADGDADKLKQIFKNVMGRYDEATGKGYELNIDWFAEEAHKLEDIRIEVHKKSLELREELKTEIAGKIKEI